jgi:hypothetical protein
VLYPHSQSPVLDPELFRCPSAAYRGAPFWAWNARLDVAQLLRQLGAFRAMGFGGANLHARTGLATEYLGDAFMAAVVACTERLARDGMFAWLYDEDRWPSGYAGGLVTRDPRHRVKHLLWTVTPYGAAPLERKLGEYTAASRSEDGTLLGRYAVVLRDGYLAQYGRLTDGEQPATADGARVWYAYLESPVESVWFNGQTYVDTLSRAAIERFIETTHERYAAAVGRHFGTTCPAIFTDEPQFTKKSQFRRADETRDLFMPWTSDFADTYRTAYGHDLLDRLPELFWNLPDDQPSVARYRYHDHTAERFAAAFGDTLAEWCGRRGIALTGHMLGEASLHGQTRGGGEVMRAMRSFQLPGIDVLSDKLELTTAKQAASLAHQFGREGVLSELYGVTGWDFDFAGHKRQGDWQAALGVTARVPHLAWVSMAGEAKRDYPASIGCQSPWHREYPLVEDHFARLNTVLTRGRPVVRVAVIHPVESAWLAWGPVEQNQPEVEEREAAFQDVTRWLAFGLIDFDYVSEALLPTQAEGASGGRFAVGAMAYDAVVVPHLRTIRATTLDRLSRFADAGGTVIFVGDVPSLVDAAASDAARRLAARCRAVPLVRRHLLDGLAPFRDVEVRRADGAPADALLHQFRADGDARHLFLCNTDRDRPLPGARIRVRGVWHPTHLDTTTGEARPIPSSVEGDHTVLPWSFPAHGHLLLTLHPGPPPAPVTVEPPRKWVEVDRLRDPVPITLSEPNVLLLDQAEWRLTSAGSVEANDGPWRPVEEVLRLDNLVRQQLGLPPRTGRAVQPWADAAPAPVVARLQLRFAIRSDVDVAAASLAVEDAANVEVHLDGQPVPNDVTGWWVDEAIETVALPPIAPGDHALVLTIPFTRKTDVEWCYLLGDFGVAVAGRHARLTAPVRRLAFGDWTAQGLPFYAGDVTYHCTLAGDGRDTLVEVPQFKAPLLGADLDGRPAGKIAFAPYQLELGRLSGDRRLDLTAYGNRANAFGPVHHTDPNLKWVGPPAWRSTGAGWAYEYQLKPMGVLTAPIVKAGE